MDNSGIAINTEARTLSQQVRSQLLLLVGILFGAFLILQILFTAYTLDFTADRVMALDAQVLLRNINENPSHTLPRDKSFSAYKQWDDIPHTTRTLFSQPPEPGDAAEAETTLSNGQVEVIYVFHYINEASSEGLQQLFVLNRYDEQDMEAFTETFISAIVNQALWVTLLLFLALFVLISWILRKTSEPFKMLSQWAAELSHNPEQSLTPNFPIAELNDIANQLERGVADVHASNQREQQFLKHASHELRTPLAIMQASLDTLSLQVNEKSQRPVQRALRASTKMSTLTNTLLWLAHESEAPIEKVVTNPKSLCQSIIKDHEYLAEHRDIHSTLNISIPSLLIEHTLFSIVLTNLIRNAYQYSAAGDIDISITTQQLTISNPLSSHNNPTRNNTQGFGLGLQLVDRICKKLHWKLSVSQPDEHFLVTITWKDTRG
ncbi:hypothetical protein A9Q99_12820 [Gammaproteobacteria bacterium 45_16_T64]|nr:hypothetical protein A9Q99_12820 [Gammaproteobacteria bacterium 45_16_T64]